MRVHSTYWLKTEIHLLGNKVPLSIFKLFIGFCINRVKHSNDIHTPFTLCIQSIRAFIHTVQYTILGLVFVRMA
jgi:hypothetical protein